MNVKTSLFTLVYLRCNYFKKTTLSGRLFRYIVSSVPRRLAEFSTHLNMKYPNEP
jgi:hypothetical protein